MEDFSELDGYGREAAPERAYMPDTESLAPGDYDCEFVDAHLKRTPNGHLLCEAVVRLLSAGGRTVQHAFWLNKQNSVNAFCADMLALGFPAGTWGSGPGKTPLSQAIPWAVARLRGMRFRACKTRREVPGKAPFPGAPVPPPTVYHDFVINGALAPGAAAPPPPMPGVGGGGGREDDIPF